MVRINGAATDLLKSLSITILRRNTFYTSRMHLQIGIPTIKTVFVFQSARRIIFFNNKSLEDIFYSDFTTAKSCS